MVSPVRYGKKSCPYSIVQPGAGAPRSHEKFLSVKHFFYQVVSPSGGALE